MLHKIIFIFSLIHWVAMVVIIVKNSCIYLYNFIESLLLYDFLLFLFIISLVNHLMGLNFFIFNYFMVK